MPIPFGRPEAIACIRGGAGAKCLSGTVLFSRCRDGILVEADLRGMPRSQTGIFGFHIHEGNCCTGSDFSDTGGHYNPREQDHPVHAGDLPPLFASNGRAYLAVLTDRFCIKDIIGRTLVVHSMPDDFHTQPAGNAGEKIACGVICKL